MKEKNKKRIEITEEDLILNRKIQKGIGSEKRNHKISSETKNVLLVLLIMIGVPIVLAIFFILLDINPEGNSGAIILLLIFIMVFLIGEIISRGKKIKKLKKDLIYQKRMRVFLTPLDEIPGITEFKQSHKKIMKRLESKKEKLEENFFKKFKEEDLYLNTINDYSKEKNKEREELINEIMEIFEKIEYLDNDYNERIDQIINSYF